MLGLQCSTACVAADNYDLISLLNFPDDSTSTKLLQSLLVRTIQTKYLYTSPLLEPVYLPDFLTEHTSSRSFKQHDFRKIIHDGLQVAFPGTEKSNTSGVFDAVAKLLISSAIKSSVPNASTGALNMRKEHKNLSKVKAYSLSTPDSVSETKPTEIKIATKLTPYRLFSHDYDDSDSKYMLSVLLCCVCVCVCVRVCVCACHCQKKHHPYGLFGFLSGFSHGCVCAG